MPGSPRGESPLVHGLHSLQGDARSFTNFREGFDFGSVPLSEPLGVGGRLSFLSLVRLESSIIPAKHFLVPGLNLSQRLKPPEVFERRIDLPLGFTQLANLANDLGIGEGHPYFFLRYFTATSMLG